MKGIDQFPMLTALPKEGKGWRYHIGRGDGREEEKAAK